MTFAVVVIVVAVVLVLVLQFVIRPRLGKRGRMAVDAFGGGTGEERILREQLARDVMSRAAPSIYQPGGPLLKGRAKKAMDQLARTVVVRADPAAVEAVVAQVVAADGRFNPAAGGVDADEVAAWETPGMFGPYPRVAVSRSTVLAGATEFGVTHYQWSMKFPQGGPVYDKLFDPLLQALSAAHLVWSEHVRDFQPDADVRVDAGDRDGRWHAAGLLPVGPDMTKA